MSLVVVYSLPAEASELLGAAWTCWILGLSTWYISGLTGIKADDRAVEYISRRTAAEDNSNPTEEDVFGPWNRQTRLLSRSTRVLLLTGAVVALAFAWINIERIGGPNDDTESRSNTDATATTIPRDAGRAGTDADTGSEDASPSSAEPAEEMSQPDAQRR